MTIFQGDNTAAFGEIFLTINLTSDIVPIPTISKAELRIGCICKKFTNPTFPLPVNFTEEETLRFFPTNTIYLAVWDSEGRKRTCEGSLTFNTQSQKV